MSETTATIRFEGSQREPHAPELYQATGTVETLPSLDAVDDAAADFYKQHGYLAVEQCLSPQEVDESRQTLDDLITGKRTGHSMTLFEAAAKEVGMENMTDEQKRAFVRKLAFSGSTGVDCGLPVLKPGLVAAVEKLMGGRESEPTQVMTLLKPGKGGREKPWHQDHAYFQHELSEPVIGVWIALDEATIDNGCMFILDGGHKLGPIHHWQRRDWQICDSEVMGKAAIAAPLPPGGALFFGSLLPHGTPTNDSDRGRRAMQFHYAPKDANMVSDEQRMAIFGTEGKDVEC